MAKKDMRKAKEIIEWFVMDVPHAASWESLVHDFVEPLELQSRFGVDDVTALARQAADGIRGEWPESASDAELWKSRTGPWCKAPTATMKIIEIVEKTALRMSRSV